MAGSPMQQPCEVSGLEVTSDSRVTQQLHHITRRIRLVRGKNEFGEGAVRLGWFLVDMTFGRCPDDDALGGRW